MQILVTGGAGYIGSVVAAELLARGHHVIVLDDLSTGHRDAVPAGADFIEACITEAGRAVPLTECDAVIHFAAKSLVAESVAQPHLYWTNNVAGTSALLESMRAAGLNRIVFSSTCATYGEPESLPITEATETRPANPYGASKLAVDHMLTSYAAAYGLAAVSLRYFNVAGARVDGDDVHGERHATETHLIPLALQVAAGQRDVFTVHGTDYPTADGSCIRDYIHVVDLSDAHLAALDRARAGEHLICNLGSGTGYSVLEVLNAVRRITGESVPSVNSSRRPGDPAQLVSSNIRATTELGWHPSRDLDRMIIDAWVSNQRARRVGD